MGFFKGVISSMFLFRGRYGTAIGQREFERLNWRELSSIPK
jgi:hypothetical protein